MIRAAMEQDLAAISAIYDAIHATAAEKTGWLPGVYPVRATAEAALRDQALFVAEQDGRVIAAARIDQNQPDVYGGIHWGCRVPESEVFVIHTLVVDPRIRRQGVGTAFLRFYEAHALAHGGTALRLDTNEKNLPARRLYRQLGYQERGIVPCVFQGIPHVRLVCLEKELRK